MHLSRGPHLISDFIWVLENYEAMPYLMEILQIFRKTHVSVVVSGSK